MKKVEIIANILKQANEEKVLVKEIDVFGYQYNYKSKVLGSVSKYWFGEHEVIESLCPLNSESNNDNRPGTKKSSTQYVVVHDTASSAPSAGSLAHARYVTNGGGGTSWHYSSGADGIYHHIPDDEVAYHAGDALVVPFGLFNTFVKGDNPNPKVEIIDGLYYLDGKKTVIKAPRVTYEYNNKGELRYASDGFIQGRKAPEGAKAGEVVSDERVTKINDAGLRVDLSKDGYYYMGPTYYSAGYGYISNRGGNLNSIGIETMVNEGSDLFLTWHKTAKLVAHLLVDNNLLPDRVKPHHFFSGKDCPMTLRHANLWEKFLEMVKIEYDILTLSKGVEIKFECDSKYIDATGRVISLPEKEETIKYTVTIKDEEEEIKLELETKLGE